MQKGFTLIEVLIAVSILTIVTFTVTLFAIDIFKAQFSIGDNLEVEEEIEEALNIIVPEIRSIADSSNGSYAIVFASSSSFSFYSNIDGDILVERIRYYLEGATFKKGVIKPSINPIVYDPSDEKITTLANNIISDNIFYYYDKIYEGSAGSQLEQPVKVSVIRSVKVNLMADRNITLPPLPSSIDAFINIRSLKI
ncbi:MAG: hypothetical protein A2817_03740 [Candidatus Yanofskybacteria bacterium RIFCSPHIGHO2_01_FULL_39_8b]|uniref:Type II secretion system protein J n=1 Tax=Candidatus Yanofskybacteria bacterium RIFCSPHIGHO2_01_FULL_39_8b TaxID=1802659 RepID=A0A1F8EEE7_9BACT|nr:MAG: hypothetical protein A2817_03740 [Candidatus Yanofskybacteria bacterium RIFCSPHIGHO2_01_FULL_39_8b]